MDPQPGCKICLEQFNSQSKLPRICIKCGRSICEKCINDIQKKKSAYQCPYCKYSSQQKWPKNLQLLQGLQYAGLLCKGHKRKVLTLCSSQICKLPIGICDLTQCSIQHKQKGTNVLPLSLLNQPLKQKIKKQEFGNIIESFHQHLKGKMSELFISLQKAQQNNKKESQIKLSKQANATISKIVNKDVDSVDSKLVYELKKQIINFDDENQQDKSIKDSFKEFKLSLIKELSQIIQKIELNDFQRIAKSKSQIKVQNKLNKNIIPQNMQIQRPITIDDKVFELIFEQLKMKKPLVHQIFNSKQLPPTQFKMRVGGKKNIIYIIQSNDGNVFGSYMNHQYPKQIKKDIAIKDPKGFIWWYNWGKIFKAREGLSRSENHFDFSVQYLVSIGNTSMFDGFWFANNFQIINPEAKTPVIWSEMFQDLKIDLTTRKVDRFRAFYF